MPNADATPVVKQDIPLLTVLSLYCVALIVLPLYWVYAHAPTLTSDQGTQSTMISLVVGLGVLGSTLRSTAELFLDVGKGKFNRRYSLAYLLRPFEGAGIALIVYIASLAGLGFLERGTAEPDPLALLSLAALSGMFAHRAAQGLAERFARFMGGSPGGSGEEKKELAKA